MNTGRTSDLQARIAAYRTDNARYPEEPPFHPDTDYPEYAHDETAVESNPAYQAVRGCFQRMGLDSDNEGTPDWNPLGDLLEPDDTVLLKPNFVKEDHPRDPEGWRYVLTHGSIIRAVADYVFEALGDAGRVVVADAPQTDSSFTAIRDVLSLGEVREFYVANGYDFSLVDMRQEEWESDGGVVVNRFDLPGDPYGYTEFDLGDASEFAEHPGQGDYYGADYNTEQVNHHHTGGRHEYLIASSAVQADVVFSLPKAKTHKKAGVTLSLKNLVGINGDKNYLPHHTEASDEHGGDEHPDPDATHQVERGLLSIARKVMTSSPFIGPRLFRAVKPLGERIFGGTDEVIRSGNWHGNDTVWRMCLDLNKLLFYGGTDGTLRADDPDNRKRHYSLCDGIVAGEGRGPMDPDPVEAGFVTFGTHPVTVDLVTTWLMGFDPEEVPIIDQAFACEDYPLTELSPDDVVVRSNDDAWDGPFREIPAAETLGFEPHFGWEGHIENAESERRERAAVS